MEVHEEEEEVLNAKGGQQRGDAAAAGALDGVGLRVEGPRPRVKDHSQRRSCAPLRDG